MSNNNILVIGIAGGTGSGKSTLTKQLVNHFGDQITVLKHDDYYKAHDEMTYEERTHLNYDHPNAVDTDADIRIIRRIQRDVIERARSLESVISQYMNTVKPMHEEFVEPSKKNADIIVLEGGMNLVAMDMIKNRIRQHLSAQTQV